MKFVPPDTSIEDYRIRRAAFLKWATENLPNMKERCERVSTWLDDNSPYEPHEKMKNLQRALYGDERH